MLHVYVAGPYRATTQWGVEQNIRVAETAAMQIARFGAVPVIPHSMYRYFDGTICDDYWLAATCSLLKRCDALYLLPNWENSEGTKLELEQAEGDGIRIFRDTAGGMKELWAYIEERNNQEGVAPLALSPTF
jgi:hypothetical protein